MHSSDDTAEPLAQVRVLARHVEILRAAIKSRSKRQTVSAQQQGNDQTLDHYPRQFGYSRPTCRLGLAGEFVVMGFGHGDLGKQLL